MNRSGTRRQFATTLAAVGIMLGTAAGIASRPALAAEAALTAVDASGPYQLIDSSSKILLAALDAHRAEYRKDPQKLYALIDATLLPHFDVEYAARLVLAQSWRTATPEQRARFVKAFYQSLLHTYGDALVEFTANQLKVFPVTVEPGADRATVRSEIKRGDGDRIPVNYSLHKTADGWKAWDVIIEGISYVKSFREDFASEIEQKGLDAVIARLESGDFKAPTGTSGAPGHKPG